MTPAVAAADGIIFDCDGVLVDVADSYGTAITRTVSHILEVLGIRGTPPATPSLIHTFKDTGGFNNEIDLAYAAILLMAAADRASLGPGEVAAAAGRCTGISSAERQAGLLADVSWVVDRLAYPGRESIVQRVFDQLFYGPALYRMVSGREPDMDGPGLIERERLLMDMDLAGLLSGRFGDRMGMVTGRGRVSAGYALGAILDLFNPAGSFFLEDEPRSMAKPNPEPLVSAIDAMNIRHCVYVGDSAEDLAMAQKASLERAVTFVGIYGTAPNPSGRLTLFRSRGAAHAVKSVASLPKLLNLA